MALLHFDGESLREQVDTLIEEIGIWVIYTRSDRRFHCTTCFNLDTRDARSDCENCFGTGYRTQLQRWLAYYSESLVRPAPANVQLLKPGFTETGENVIFTRARNIPTAGDRFFIVEWNTPRDRVATHSGQPLRILEALRIDKVEPHIAAEVIYHTAHCGPITEVISRLEPVLLRAPISISR